MKKRYLNKNGVFNITGVNVGIQICFDIWFPEASREQVFESADLLCVIANFGSDRSYKISQIRAIENLTPVVICNRVGEEKTSIMNASFLGLSSIISSSGEMIISGKQYIEYATCCEVIFSSTKSNTICDDLR